MFDKSIVVIEGSSSSRVTLVVKLLRFLTVGVSYGLKIELHTHPGDRHPMLLLTLHIMSDVYVSGVSNLMHNSVVTWVHLANTCNVNKGMG